MYTLCILGEKETCLDLDQTVSAIKVQPFDSELFDKP